MKLITLMQKVWALSQVDRIMRRLVKYFEDRPEEVSRIESSIFVDSGQLVKVLRVANCGNKQRITKLKKILEETEVETNEEE